MKHEGGGIFVWAIVVSAVLFLLSMTLLTVVNAEMYSSQSFADSTRAFYSAEAGLAAAISYFRQNRLVAPPARVLENGAGYFVAIASAGPSRYTITSTGTSGRVHRAVTQTVRVSPGVLSSPLYIGGGGSGGGSDIVILMGKSDQIVTYGGDIYVVGSVDSTAKDSKLEDQIFVHESAGTGTLYYNNGSVPDDMVSGSTEQDSELKPPNILAAIDEAKGAAPEISASSFSGRLSPGTTLVKGDLSLHDLTYTSAGGDRVLIVDGNLELGANAGITNPPGGRLYLMVTKNLVWGTGSSSAAFTGALLVAGRLDVKDTIELTGSLAAGSIYPDPSGNNPSTIIVHYDPASITGMPEDLQGQQLEFGPWSEQ
jgi:hypothetical protein